MVDMLIASLPSAVCVLLGMILIIVEVFLPGFGLPGIGGIVLVGAGVVMVGMHFGSLTAVGTLLVIIAVLAVLVSWVLRQASRGGGKRSDLFLQERDDLRTQQEDMKVLVGKSGTTTSVLRPAGIGDFDGVRLNVVTEGGFIEKGEPIEIVRVDGSRIVVRPTAAN